MLATSAFSSLPLYCVTSGSAVPIATVPPASIVTAPPKPLVPPPPASPPTVTRSAGSETLPDADVAVMVTAAPLPPFADAAVVPPVAAIEVGRFPLETLSPRVTPPVVAVRLTVPALPPAPTEPVNSAVPPLLMIEVPMVMLVPVIETLLPLPAP